MINLRPKDATTIIADIYDAPHMLDTLDANSKVSGEYWERFRLVRVSRSVFQLCFQWFAERYGESNITDKIVELDEYLCLAEYYVYRDIPIMQAIYSKPSITLAGRKIPEPHSKVDVEYYVLVARYPKPIKADLGRMGRIK